MTLSHPQRMQLKKFLESYFNLTELEEIEVYLTGSQDNLGGNNKSIKALEIVEYARRRIQFALLFEAIHFKDASIDLQPYGGPAPQSGNAVVEAATTHVQEHISAAQEPVPEGVAYENFDIRIGLRRDDGRYPVSAESVGGETGETLHQLPAGDADFADFMDLLRALIARPDEARQFGKKLRDFLFTPEVWNLFTRSLEIAKARGKKGLRVLLRFNLDSPELNRIPWEYCTDDRNFLALNNETPVLRYLPTNRTPSPITVPETVRILVVLANPNDTDTLNLDKEKERIEKALTKLVNRNRVKIEVLPNATRRELRRAFRKFDPHILHFSGHGTLNKAGEGALLLVGDDGKSVEVDSDDLMVLLRSSSVKLVILSACETAAIEENAAVRGENPAILGVAPRLVWDGVPAVVGMQFAVPDTMAVQFMQDLYEFLADGEPLDAAITEARIGAYFDDDENIYWAIPVLFMRAPNGNIWQ